MIIRFGTAFNTERTLNWRSTIGTKSHRNLLGHGSMRSSDWQETLKLLISEPICICCSRWVYRRVELRRISNSTNHKPYCIGLNSIHADFTSKKENPYGNLPTEARLWFGPIRLFSVLDQEILSNTKAFVGETKGVFYPQSENLIDYAASQSAG
jgi:hypothetical protein